MKNEILERVLNGHKNLIVEGDVGAGKTTNVLFPIVDDIINKKESLFVLDSREEYINEYYNKLKENDYNIIILNLRDMDKSDGWNPLEHPYNLYKNGDTDKAQEYLEKIGKIMFYENSTQDPFWAITASDFFTGVTLALFEDGKAEEINLNSVNNMFNGIDKKFGVTDYITEYFKSKDVTSKPYIFASTTFLAPRETKGSILSVARQKLRLYVSREKLSQIMNKTTFDFNDLKEKPTAIILIAKDENKSVNTIAAMFIEQLYAILVDLKITNRFNLILDNFDILERCNDIVDILGSCLSRNIKTYIGTRSVLDISNAYGTYMSKFCDLVNIGNSSRGSWAKLEFDNNMEEKIDTNFEKVIIKNADIDYPKIKTSSIKLFDLENMVKDIKTKQLETTDFSKFNLGEPFNADDLIKSIDAKIEQLEIEERMEQLNSENSEKSEFEQFKIDDKNN